MPEFIHSWAFAFILGTIIGGCFGIVIAAVLAVSSRASREEERREAEIVTQNNPRTD